MKKIKFSLTALALIVAIAGTATANAKKEVVDPCKIADPKGICTSQTGEECCEDDFGNIWHYPPIER